MSELRKVAQTVKFSLAVGEAKPNPALAPILGQSQISIQAFCKDFNEMTTQFNEGVKLIVKIKKFEDKSFKIFYSSPSLNYILEQVIMNRRAKSEDVAYVKIHELLDILKIMKSYFSHEKLEVREDSYYLKAILSFLDTKNIKLLK